MIASAARVAAAVYSAFSDKSPILESAMKGLTAANFLLSVRTSRTTEGGDLSPGAPRLTGTVLPVGGGGLLSTVQDYTKFAQMILRKGFHAGIDSYSAFRENDRMTRTGLDGYLKARGFTQFAHAFLLSRASAERAAARSHRDRSSGPCPAGPRTAP